MDEVILTYQKKAESAKKVGKTYFMSSIVIAVILFIYTVSMLDDSLFVGALIIALVILGNGYIFNILFGGIASSIEVSIINYKMINKNNNSKEMRNVQKMIDKTHGVGMQDKTDKLKECKYCGCTDIDEEGYCNQCGMKNQK